MVESFLSVLLEQVQKHPEIRDCGDKAAEVMSSVLRRNIYAGLFRNRFQAEDLSPQNRYDRTLIAGLVTTRYWKFSSFAARIATR